MPIFEIEEEINLNSWNDIINRSSYESSTKPKKYHYTEIKAFYSFKDDNVLCGVSDCLQSHKQGFLVATKDDKETNICEACGKRFFGVSFDKQKKSLQDQANLRKQKIRLNKILVQDNTKKRVNEIKQANEGANWLYKVLSSFCNTYPFELITALKELANNKDDNSIISALLSDSVANSSQLESIEQLQGLNIFLLDIREELIDKILKPLLELEKLASDPESISSLTRYCKWADGLDEQIAYVEELVKEGQAFFRKWNLERLKSIPLPENSARIVRTSSWSINKAIKNT